jgi:glucosamine 6-phosphate synthetase-like amidotransferase/phosphosugar isomerase protein
MWKAPGNPVRLLGMVGMMQGATMVVGHVRFATHGRPADNITNHPHPCDGGWIVHNGVVGNYARLVSDFRLVPVSECDSEVIGMLAERSEEKTHMGRMVSAVEQLAGRGAVVLGLWNRPRKLVAVRAGNPLHLAETDGGYYMGSVNGGFPEETDVFAVQDHTAICFTCRGIATDVERDVVKAEAIGTDGKWADRAIADGTYRGG